MKVTPSSRAHTPHLSYQAARALVLNRAMEADHALVFNRAMKVPHAFASVPADCCPCEKDGCCCCC